MPRAETSAQSADELTPYQLKPPEWRPLLHPGSRHLGIPDFFPPRSGQPEDVISEATVRSGLTGKPVVASETFSAHNLIYDRLKCDTLLPQLGTFLEEVLERRQELQRESVAPFQCRIPPRVTLNDLKLGAYIRDLADPAVPLSRLARSVPHGYRGDKMLDMLWSGGAPAGSNSAYFNSAVATTSSANAERKSVEIPRAVWFIRVVGASEIVSSAPRAISAQPLFVYYLFY